MNAPVLEYFHSVSNSPLYLVVIVVAISAKSAVAEAQCGGAHMAVRFSERIVKASFQFPVRVFSLTPNITFPLPLYINPATSAFWSGSAGHHAALLDSPEPAIAVVTHSPADSVAMAV